MAITITKYAVITNELDLDFIKQMKRKVNKLPCINCLLDLVFIYQKKEVPTMQNAKLIATPATFPPTTVRNADLATRAMPLYPKL